MIAGACDPLDDLRKQGESNYDTLRFHYLTLHRASFFSDKFTPIKLLGRKILVSFQHHWLQRFPKLSYNKVLEGGICRYFVLFPQQLNRGPRGITWFANTLRKILHQGHT